ncbi:hypothetical protein GDO81_027677 [Engystomops pustulosus]|uniref:Uncharacterized protein n=1 Tax=Engystomops pustulosus TaxID=76066 RepID=A0AAV6YKU6_ENGPU|nr:hypothetical protein GDO81_027677 [Engystomops pustulosus]
MGVHIWRWDRGCVDHTGFGRTFFLIVHTTDNVNKSRLPRSRFSGDGDVQRDLVDVFETGSYAHDGIGKISVFKVILHLLKFIFVS